MKKIIVIGGGFAGLSSAVYLTEKGYNVLVLEASPKLGGRAYSFEYNNTYIDNGQHLLMGCYNYTLKFLEKISALKNFELQNQIDVSFVKKGGELKYLKALSSIYPFNLFYALLNFDVLSLNDKILASKFLFKLALKKPEEYKELSVEDLLQIHNQSDNLIKTLWNPIVVSTMNVSCSTASAESFVLVLKSIFLKGNKASTFVLPKYGLSECYCESAVNFIKSNGGDIFLSEKIVQIESLNGRVEKILSAKNEYSNFESVVFAVPPFAIKKIVGMDQFISANLIEFDYSSIISIHVWLDKISFQKSFYGLIESKLDWLFVHKKHITLLKSSADEDIHLSNYEIFEKYINEIKIYFPEFDSNSVKDYKVIKEKRATFVADKKTEQKRRSIPSSNGNVFFTGDWTNTGLPSTIESAVKSGEETANRIFMKNWD